MHHFIYPSQDTFITDTIGFENLNFGLDETLRVGTEVVTSKVVSPVTIIPISSSVSNLCISGFSGSIVNSTLYGTASFAFGSITSSINANVTSSKFTGVLTGSYLSASLLTGSAFTGSLVNFTGSFNGIFSGSISGSLWTDYLQYFNGNVIGFTGKIITGSINGADILQQQNITVNDVIYVNRSLVQFDITSISQSIVSGDIINPTFKLKLYVAREFNLPIQYNVYAFPISESWVMGNGYISDNGSLEGASWIYRDYVNGTPWAVTGSSYIQSLGVTQSFNYQVGDIYMNVTPIVNAWLSGTVPNNGIVLISSDEFSPTGSGMSLRFFSKDTNTIYEPVLDVGWSDFSWSTGSVITSSVNISTIPAGLLGVVTDSGSISGSIYGGFCGVGNIFVSSSIDPVSGSSGSFITNSYANGFISVMGTSCLITSMSINGHFSGSTSSSMFSLIKKCRRCKPNQFVFGTNDSDTSVPFYPGAGDDEAFFVIDGQFPSMYPPYPNVPSFISSQLSYLNGQDQTQYQGHDIYGWGNPFNEFNQYDWTSAHGYQEEFGPGSITLDCCGPKIVTMSYVMGTLIDGLFSGSTFTSSLFKGYILGHGWLVGSWNESMILGTNISASYPFQPMFPTFMNVVFSGSYVNGPAFGSITQLSASSGILDYGIFSGVFTGGHLAGIQIYTPFTGSILTSSYSYTSSANITASVLNPVDIRSPFATVVQNIPTSVHAGDIIKVNVFGRPQFPLKNFNRQTQFTQFLIPQYLPTSSYYAIKDNETEQIILDFDNYTQISCDPNGNYFLLDTTSFPQERYFKILIRVEQSGSKYTFDKGNIFKIVR